MIILDKGTKIRKLAVPMQMPSHMEINGNHEVVVEGCTGVLQYDTETVRIKMGRQIACFKGRGLVIKCLTCDSLVVTGFLTGIEFCV